MVTQPVPDSDPALEPDEDLLAADPDPRYSDRIYLVQLVEHVTPSEYLLQLPEEAAPSVGSEIFVQSEDESVVGRGVVTEHLDEFIFRFRTELG